MTAKPIKRNGLRLGVGAPNAYLPLLLCHTVHQWSLPTQDGRHPRDLRDNKAYPSLLMGHSTTGSQGYPTRSRRKIKLTRKSSPTYFSENPLRRKDERKTYREDSRGVSPEADRSRSVWPYGSSYFLSGKIAGNTATFLLNTGCTPT